MQFKDAVYKIRYTIDEMQAMTGLGNKVSMLDFAIIEDKVQITHGKKKALKEPIRLGFVVFDNELPLKPTPINLFDHSEKTMDKMVLGM